VGEHRDRIGGRVRDPEGPRRAPRHQSPGKESETYQGRRRWPEPVRRRLLAGTAALGVSLMVVAGLAFKLPDEARQPDAAAGVPEAARRPADTPVPGRTTPSGVPISGQPEPGVPPITGPGGPPPWPIPTATTSPTERASPPPPQAPPPFSPIQIEAEDARNTISGGAQAVSYGGASGGILVRDIGNPGALTVPVSVPTAGQYNLLIRIAVPDGAATLTLVVAVAGAIPVAVPVSGRPLCCSNGIVTVTLGAGANWITFGNPTDRGPAIDFVRITRSN